MKDAEVPVMGYAPAGWPPGVACVVRRVRIPAANVSTDPRARKRGTIPKDQLALALDSLVDEVFGYSFIATNLDASTPAPAGTTARLDLTPPRHRRDEHTTETREPRAYTGHIAMRIRV